MICFTCCDWIAKKLSCGKRCVDDGAYNILLTGTFHSENWVMSHIKPLTRCRRVNTVFLVTVSSAPSLDGVVVIRPPKMLVKLIGGVPSRLLTFAWCAIAKRPDIVGGFHLLLNGLLASLLAKLTGAYSLYSCCGGENEVKDGGLMSENRLFEKMGVPDLYVESLLLRAINETDLVACRGHRAIDFFKKKGVNTTFSVIPGGIDGERFSHSSGKELEKQFDIIFVGRLSPNKRVDLLLESVALIAESYPLPSVCIIGEGEEMTRLQEQAVALGIEKCVHFLGKQDDVEIYLRRSKVFVLPSESEGMSLAMIEAMLCEVPVVVSNVGELGDVVENGVNGYLVGGRSAEVFASPLLALLQDEEGLREFGQKARRSAMKCTVKSIADTWDSVLEDLPSLVCVDKAG